MSAASPGERTGRRGSSNGKWTFEARRVASRYTSAATPNEIDDM